VHPSSRRRLTAAALLLAACAGNPRNEARVPPHEAVPFGPAEREAELAFLRDALADTYAHLETKRQQWGVDLDEEFERHQGPIRRADTWADHERVMVSFVSAFRDGHLTWRRERDATEPPRRIVRIGLDTRFVGHELLVSDVWPGSDAERAGLAVGDRIVALEGRFIEVWFGQLSRVRAWSTVEVARYHFEREWPASRVDADAPLTRHRVTRLLPGGGYETLRVSTERRRPGAGPEAPVELDSEEGFHWLRVRTLDLPREVIREHADAVRDVLTARPRPLLVDLRGNGGGFDQAAREVAGIVSDTPVRGATFRVRLSRRVLAERRDWRDLAEDPARPGWSTPQPFDAEPAAAERFPLPVAVLVDAGCISACESLTLVLRAWGARVFGTRTGGSSGGPIRITLPRTGARVAIPVWALYDLDGEPVEGRGVAPDEHVDITREDILTRRDPARDRAVAWLLGGAAHPAEPRARRTTSRRDP
jgi:hypothetical protein